MRQPKEIPGFATDATFASGTEAGLTTRERPADAILERGFEADKRRPAAWENWVLGTMADNLRVLVDMYAVNFPEVIRETSLGFTPLTGAAHRIAGCSDANFQPWLCILENGYVQRSANGRNWTQGANLASMTDLSGSQDTILATVNGNQAYWSDDAGANWDNPSGTFSLAVCDRIEYSNELELWFATGTGTASLQTSPPYDGSAQVWTGHTPPWSAVTSVDTYGPRIIVPRDGESGEGVLFVPTHAGEDEVFYTLDGTTYGATATGYTGLSDACWHEADGLWYLITANGELLSSPTVDGSWTLVQSLWQPGGSNYTRIKSWGRNLMILGFRVSGPTSPLVGGLVAAHPSSDQYLAFIADDGAHTHIAEYGGRMVLSRAPGGANLFLALGMRAPWPIATPGA